MQKERAVQEHNERTACVVVPKLEIEEYVKEEVVLVNAREKRRSDCERRRIYMC